MSKPETKHILTSRTFWFNALTLLAAALATIGDHTIIADNPVAAGGVLIAASIINLGLRTLTSKAVK